MYINLYTTKATFFFLLFFVWRESLPDFLNISNKNKSASFDLHFYPPPRLQLFIL